MSKIRSRGIAYGCIAIDVIAQTDQNRIESISHASQHKMQKKSIRLEIDQRDIPMKENEGYGKVRFPISFQSIFIMHRESRE